MKYQTGIQNTVLQIIKKADKLGLPYITKDQIVEEITRYMDLNKPEEQVGQALYQLQKEGKFVKKRIEKVRIPKKEKKLRPEDEYYTYGWKPSKETRPQNKIIKELIAYAEQQLEDSMLA